jgi:hypothetical protein
MSLPKIAVGFLVLGVLAPTSGFASANTAASSSPIRIVKISYDSPGPDTSSTGSLNAEWIRLKNTGKTSRSLTGWTVRDKSGRVYRFGSYKLGAGKTVTVHTGRGSSTSTVLYAARTSYLWSNSGDTATLRNAKGQKIDSCSLPKSKNSTTC